MQIITLSGNIGRDAEVRQTPSGQIVCNFNVAASEKGRDGQESTTWYRCAVWGRRGDAIAQYLTKGTRVSIVGRLSLGVYTGNDGVARVDANVSVDEIDFSGPRHQDAQSQQQAQPVQQYGQAQTYATTYDRMAAQQPAQQAYGDEIPF